MKAVRKGKEYVRHIKKILAENGIGAATIPRSGAGDIKGDLWIGRDSTRVVAEAKRQERIAMWEWIQQAKQQSRSFPWAVIFSRNNEGDDYICLSLHYFIELLKELKET